MRQVEVARRAPCGREQWTLELDLVPGDHTRPGQFTAVHVRGLKPAFFALASSPGEPALLLVKRYGATAEALAQMPVGEHFGLSDTIGDGFDLEAVAGLPLVILCTGSALAAIRPVVRAEIAAGLPRAVHLLYGVRTLEERCFSRELAAWEDAGVEVTTVVSRDPGRNGTARWVQHEAARQGLVRADVGVVLAGVPGMIEEATALYLAAGCPRERLLQNF